MPKPTIARPSRAKPPYMNEESLAISLAERRCCFWSRSRRQLWRKGEESGNVPHIVSITADCDEDALLVQVSKEGPACHTAATISAGEMPNCTSNTKT